MFMRTLCLVSIMVLASACSGPNPNPGERTVDMAWTSRDFSRAYAVAKRPAEKGEPWAQLRLGIFYENGWGVDQDHRQAVFWYKKAMVQKATGGWANGKIVGAFGEFGYFNQNSDALIAEYNLAVLYYKGEEIPRNLPKALSHVSNVIAESGDRSVFFCCEFAGGRLFTQKQFAELRTKIEADMTPAERDTAQSLLGSAPYVPEPTD